jgi:predicted Zn-dependent peptidase
MKKYVLKNGLTILHEPRKSDTITIEVCAKVGSNYENKSIAGISHFLEHLLFEGSETRTAKQISEAIENVGGEMNAATSNERTFFYVKLPKKRFELGLDILSDIIKNPLFRPDIIEKERKVILEEIRMITDQPLHYQWIFFQNALFKKHPAKHPIHGTFDSVKSIKREQIVSYHEKWYCPNNLIICVVGLNQPPIALIEKYFGDMKPRKIKKPRSVSEPVDKHQFIKKEKRNVEQTYLVLGYKTVPRTHKDSLALDVISSVFSKGLSGRITEEIRIKRGLAYSVGTAHEPRTDYGFFVFYLNCENQNLALCKKIILNEINSLDNIKKQELANAKEFIIGNTLLNKESSNSTADDLIFWETVKDARLAEEYLRNIRKVSKQDIIRARNKYLNDNYTLIVISK